MVTIDPPYLELAFYVGRERVQDQALRAVDSLVRAGARFTGEIDVVEGDLVSRLSSVELSSIELNSSARLRSIYLDGATGVTTKTELIEIRGGVLQLRTEGELFSGPNREHRAQLYRLGMGAYACFKRLALGIESYYGALCGEYSLEEPAELKRDPRSIAFRNFFVSRVALGEGTVEVVRRTVGADVYVEELGDQGLYFSMSPEFNPDHQEVEPIESQYRSVRVAESLVKQFEGLNW